MRRFLSAAFAALLAPFSRSSAAVEDRPRAKWSLGDLISAKIVRYSGKFDRQVWRARRDMQLYVADPFKLLNQLASPRALLCALILVVTLGKGAAALPAVFAGPIRHLNAIAPQNDYTFTLAQDAGKAISVPLDPGVANRYINVYIGAQVDVAGAVLTSIKNKGLTEALFDEIGVTDSGDPIVRCDPRLMAFSSNFMCELGTTNNLRLTSTAIGTYQIASVFRVWFENPQSVEPKETLFLEHMPVSKNLQFYLKPSTRTTGAPASTIGAGAICVAPVGSTVTLSNVVMKIQQYSDETVSQGNLPIFRPRVDQQTYNFAAVGDFPIDIQLGAGQYLRGLTFATVDATANDLYPGAVQAIQLSDDQNRFVGKQAFANLNILTRAQMFDSGGDLFGLYDAAILHYNFQSRGRLSYCYNAAQGSNLRIWLRITTIPGGGLNVIVNRHLLERDNFTDATTGRRVTTATPPADLFA